MDNTKAAYNKLVKRVAGLKKEGETDQNVFAEYKAKFVDAISNDLNTSMAITVLYDLLKADTNDITKYELIKDFDKVLSLNLENAKSTETTEGVDAEKKQRKQKILRRQMPSVTNCLQKESSSKTPAKVWYGIRRSKERWKKESILI